MQVMVHLRKHGNPLRGTRPSLWESKTGKKLIVTHVKAGKSVAAILE